MPLIYEINIEANISIAAEFEEWLDSYTQRVLREPGFLRADRYQRNPHDENQSPQMKLWTIHYTLKDRSSYEQYVKGLSIAMRQEAKERFGDQYKATRRLLGLQLSRVKE